ncbi:MAG: hypothetical protein ACXVCY_08720 [Pseudobdellovibrionaceae bacterium]
MGQPPRNSRHYYRSSEFGSGSFSINRYFEFDLSHKNTTAPPPEMTLVGAYQMSSGALNTFLGTSNKAIVGTPATGDLLGVPDYLIPRPRPPMGNTQCSIRNGRWCLYITSVGMDACAIRIDNEAAEP